jgi:hypothetical protein
MRRSYWIAFVVCAIAATVPLAVTRTPPMTDLPEHMAQVAIWKHFDDPCQRFPEVFELNFVTPYLTGYMVVRAIAVFCTVTTATKIAVWLTIVLLPLALRALLRRGGGDEWYSLLGFPLAYGYPFYWGFLNFFVALPIAIFFLALLFDRKPRDFARALLAVLLILSHGLVFAFCAVVTLAVALARRSLRPLVALLPAFLVAAAYLVYLRESAPVAFARWTWRLGWHRFVELPSLLFSNAWEPWGFPLVVAISVAVAVAKPRVTLDRARWAFFAVAAAVYFLAPHEALSNELIFLRFALMVPVAALFLFDEPRGSRRVARALVVAIVLVWMSVLAVRFQRFDEEARPFEAVRDAIPPARRVLLFDVASISNHVPGVVYIHYAALVQVQRGGAIAWSFANWYPQIVRYRPDAEPPMQARRTAAAGVDWHGVLQYDYLLVRGSDPRLWLFRTAPAPLTLRLHSGDWWLFETPRARTQQRRCAPLGE